MPHAPRRGIGARTRQRHLAAAALAALVVRRGKGNVALHMRRVNGLGDQPRLACARCRTPPGGALARAPGSGTLPPSCNNIMTQKTNKSKQFSDFFLKKSENKLNKFHNNCLIYIEFPASRCYIVSVPRVDHGVKNGETVMNGQMLNYLPGEGVLRLSLIHI